MLKIFDVPAYLSSSESQHASGASTWIEWNMTNRLEIYIGGGAIAEPHHVALGIFP